MKSLYTRKTALITGASAGLGREFAHLFAAEHHDVVLVARRRARLEELAKTLEADFKIRAEVIVQDLRLPESAAAIVAELEHRNLRVDALVNNAGVGKLTSFVEYDLPQTIDMMAVNMRALVQLTHLLLPTMIAAGHGRILNIGSMAGFLPGPHMAVYYATKAFVNSFSEALAEELRGTGVTVTVCCPGPTATEFGSVAGSDARKLAAARTMSAELVARTAYHALQAERVICIPGYSNKIILQLLRLFPRALVRRLAGIVNRAATQS